MMLPRFPLTVVALSLATLTGCFKQAKAPEAPARKGAQSSDQCETPAPSGGGAYLAGTKGSWAEVKVLLERDCTSCHAKYLELDIVKAEAAGIVNSIDGGSMPKNASKLSIEDRTVYMVWLNNGAPTDGEEPAEPGNEDPQATDPTTPTGSDEEEAEEPGNEETAPADDECA